MSDVYLVKINKNQCDKCRGLDCEIIVHNSALQYYSFNDDLKRKVGKKNIFSNHKSLFLKKTLA